jgi:hypothetical protein
VAIGEETWWAYSLREAVEYALDWLAQKNKGLAIW